MFIKIMRGDGIADSNYDKEYQLIEVASCSFSKGGDWRDGNDDSLKENKLDPCVYYTDKHGNNFSVRVRGNVYVLNDQGKTVDTWTPAISQRLADDAFPRGCGINKI